ncbi:MFS transporter [Gracilibacillus salinarum]|uniref:MFS transporter n=1 Tax=Gracilibacillus salinarum TaxID=2932255 RepID=A0ABY4GKR6_9BACI|nr:MFS transporter [Gracilibacillus salinarum]UOQ84819.1 MFS transporter [Gracilibacillus salinarum]
MFRKVWRNKHTRYYLLGGGISKLGDVLSGMAFLFLAYDVTKSNALTTVMAIAETMPYLLFGLIGGVVADWADKRKLLIILDIVRIPLVFSVVCFYYLDLLSFYYLLIVSFLIQSIGCFFNPAHRSVLPAITPEDYRTAVNSINDSLSRGVKVLSPFLSVWVLNHYGAIHFFTIDTITYAVSAWCISRITINDQASVVMNKSVNNLFRSIGEFTHWAASHLTIRRLFLCTFITVFFNTWVWEVGMLLALSQLSKDSEALYSMLQGVFGGVVIVTNILLPFFLKRMSLLLYLFGSIIWGIGITYYGFVFEINHFFIGSAIVGIGLPIAGLTRIHLLQTLVPDDKMGRAFSTNAVLLYLSNTVSLAVYGFLVSFLSIRTLMLWSGMFIVCSSVIGLLVTMDSAKFRRRFTINLFK